MSEENSVGLLKQVMGIVDWLNEQSGGGGGGGGAGGIGGGGGGISLSPLKLRRELDLALSKVGEKEVELRRERLENCELLEGLEGRDREIGRLKGELEREKWERCHAEVNLGEMGRAMARLYERVDELLEVIGGGEMEGLEEEDDDEVQIIGVERKTGFRGNFEEIWGKLGRMRGRVEEKYRKWEEFGEETRRELEKTRGFIETISKTMEDLKKRNEEAKKLEEKTPAIVTPTVEAKQKEESPPSTITTPTPKATPQDFGNILEELFNQSDPQIDTVSMVTPTPDLPIKTEDEDAKEPTTLTLTFHRSTESPPPPIPTDYPPHQIDFFHTLLGLPTSTYSTITSPISPPLPPSPQSSPPKSRSPPPPVPAVTQAQVPQVPQMSSVIKFAGPKAKVITSPSPSSKLTQSPEKMEVDPNHGVDPTKRDLGFFCLCGLECSTKKTLQYHLQFFESTHLTNTMTAPVTMTTPPIPPPTVIAITPTTNTSDHENTVIPSASNSGDPMTPHKKPYPHQHQRSKQCKRCGKCYNGGKEGLQRHILQEHSSHHNLATPLAPIEDHQRFHQDNLFRCNDCPEIFRTVVQLRLHHKVKHHQQQQQRGNWKGLDELLD